MRPSPPTRTWTSGAAAALVLGIVLVTEARHVDEPHLCGGICTMLEQAHAYTHGGDPWTGDTMDGLEPGCPDGISSLYTPASLWALSPLAERVGAVCEVWPRVQLAAYAISLIAAASLLSGWRSVWMLACVLWVRSWLDDPTFHDTMTGQVGSLEAAGVWTLVALGARSRWWGLVVVAWVTGLQKQVYWLLGALPLLARRTQVAVAGLGAMVAVHVAMGSLDPDGYSKWIQMASSHDERGVIHPSLRSLVHDLGDRVGVPTAQSEFGWLAVCALVGGALWWGSRRAPGWVATGDSMLLCALAYLAVTPYLKDYTLVVAVPGVAAALVMAHPIAAVAMVLVQVTTGALGGYHALAVIWAAFLSQAVRVARLALRDSSLSAPDPG